MEKVHAYVDGSYNKRTNTSGYGVMIYINDKQYSYCGVVKSKEDVTMQSATAELGAARKAVERALKYNCKELIIYYDFDGVEKWASGKLKPNNKETQSYKSYMNQAKKRMKITFEKVKAHSGNEGNYFADRLAKYAAGTKLSKQEKEICELLINQTKEKETRAKKDSPIKIKVKVTVKNSESTLKKEKCVAYVSSVYDNKTHKYGYGVVLCQGKNRYNISVPGSKNGVIDTRTGEIEGIMLAINKAEELGCSEIKIYNSSGINIRDNISNLKKPKGIEHSKYTDLTNTINDENNLLKISFDNYTTNDFIGRQTDIIAKNAAGCKLKKEQKVILATLPVQILVS